MIYICHVDPNRQDCVVQADMLKKTYYKVNPSGTLVFLYKNYAKDKYNDYNLDKNYPVYNRHIALIDYINAKKLYNENIGILDPDMVFNYEMTFDIKPNTLYASEWIPSKSGQQFEEDCTKVCKGYENAGFDKNTKLFPFAVPYFGKGNVLLELSKKHLEIDGIIRQTVKLHNPWLSEMYSLAYAASILNIEKVYVPKLSDIHNWAKTEDSENSSYWKSLSLVHYCRDIIGSKNRVVKFDMKNTGKITNCIREFGKPTDAFSEYMIEIFKEYYNVR